MKAIPINNGDTFVLFNKLPYYFDKDLPLKVAPYVYLDNTPDILLKPEYEQWQNILLPMSQLDNIGYCHCCLHLSKSESRTNSYKASNHLLFTALNAMRLHAPLHIDIASGFEYSEDIFPFKELHFYHMQTCWQPAPHAFYTAKDFRSVLNIADEILCHNAPQNRLNIALLLFSHVTLGWSKSYQLSCMGLFAALEALFLCPQDNQKAIPLAERVSTFLSNHLLYDNSLNWLKKEYKESRNNLVHGRQDVYVEINELSEARKRSFGCLHEITRLSLLGFLSEKDEALFTYKRKDTQKALEELGPSKSNFLKGQKVWCEEIKNIISHPS